jgi:hypothetical protein
MHCIFYISLWLLTIVLSFKDSRHSFIIFIFFFLFTSLWFSLYYFLYVFSLGSFCCVSWILFFQPLFFSKNKNKKTSKLCRTIISIYLRESTFKEQDFFLLSLLFLFFFWGGQVLFHLSHAPSLSLFLFF